MARKERWNACAEVRSENTESKRTNQRGEIVILFAITFKNDVAFMSLVIPPPTTSKLLSCVVVRVLVLLLVY